MYRNNKSNMWGEKIKLDYYIFMQLNEIWTKYLGGLWSAVHKSMTINLTEFLHNISMIIWSKITKR